MSSYEIRAARPGLRVTVGWDNPMSTFFARVARLQDDSDRRDPILLWIGSSPREIPRAEDLVKPLAHFAYLLGDMIDRLRTDPAPRPIAARPRCNGKCCVSDRIELAPPTSIVGDTNRPQ